MSSLEQEEIQSYLKGELKAKEIKKRIIDKRAKLAGIMNGKPFEELCTNDLDWIRLSTKELDIFRWKGKVCFLCKKHLSTDHLKSCVGKAYDRELIKKKTGIEAEKILEDPSVLNKSGTKTDIKSLKSFVAGRISKMIHSAGRSVIM